MSSTGGGAAPAAPLAYGSAAEVLAWGESFPVAEADAWLAAQGERLGRELPAREALERLRLKSLRAESFFPSAYTGGEAVEDLPPLLALVWKTLREVQLQGAEAPAGSYAAFAMPRDLCLLELEGLCRTSSSWLVTPKDDGVRALVLVLYDKPFAILRGKPWVTDLCPEMSFLASAAGPAAGPQEMLLLDTERVELAPGTTIYRVCDLLACGQRSYLSLPFGQRLWLRDVLLKAHFSHGARPRREDWPCLVTKTFVPLRDLQRDLLPQLERPAGARGWGFFERGSGAWGQDAHECRVPVDGLVFARGDAPYRGGGQRALRKWKFEQPTLDLEVLRAVRHERGYWVCWGLRCPALRPWRPALHSEVAFDWALIGQAARRAVEDYWGAWLLRGPAPGAAGPGPENTFYAPHHELRLVNKQARTLPGAWACCHYRQKDGVWRVVRLILEAMPGDQHTAESRAWPVDWVREPGRPGAGGGQPAVCSLPLALEELLRYKEAGARADLTPRTLCFRVCGTDVQEAGSVVGLAYALPWQDHALGLEGTGPLPPAAGDTQTFAAPALAASYTHEELQQLRPVPGAVWEVALTAGPAGWHPRPLHPRAKKEANFHTTVLQALRAVASCATLDSLLALDLGHAGTAAAAAPAPSAPPPADGAAPAKRRRKSELPAAVAPR